MNFDQAARIGVDAVSPVIAADSKVTIVGLGGADEAAGSEAAPPLTPEGSGRSAGPVWPFILLPSLFLSVFGLIFWGGVAESGEGLRRRWVLLLAVGAPAELVEAMAACRAEVGGQFLVVGTAAVRAAEEQAEEQAEAGNVQRGVGKLKTLADGAFPNKWKRL